MPAPPPLQVLGFTISSAGLFWLADPETEGASMQTGTMMLLKIIWEHKMQRTQGHLEISLSIFTSPHTQSEGFDKSVSVFKLEK